MTKGRVLFNAKCSVCNFEIQHYKKRSSLEYTDCSKMDDKYLKALHIQFENGTELAGVPAFIYVWQNTKGYEWLAKLVRLPIIFQFSQFAYAIVAKVLFWRFKLFN